MFTSRHEKLPGVQIWLRHTPALQVCVAVHAVVVYPKPSGLHARLVLPSQLAEPGVQIHPAQRPVASAQLAPVPQIVVAP